MTEMIDILNIQLSHIEGELETNLKNFLTQLKAQGVPKAVDMYVDLRNLNDRYEAVGKAISDAVSELKGYTIPNKFETEGVTSFTSANGYRVTVSSTTRASMGDNRGAAFDWLRENGLGALVTETVNASTLSATAKTLLEEGRELPPDLFKVYLLANTSITKVKPKG